MSYTCIKGQCHENSGRPVHKGLKFEIRDGAWGHTHFHAVLICKKSLI